MRDFREPAAGFGVPVADHRTGDAVRLHVNQKEFVSTRKAQNPRKLKIAEIGMYGLRRPVPFALRCKGIERTGMSVKSPM